MEAQSDVYLKKQWFIKSNPGIITEFYDFDAKKVLGSGTYGQVYKAKKKESKISRAIKAIPKKKVKNADKFQKEIDIMRNLDHPNIIKLFESFEDEKNVYLILELCEGGELFDRINQKGQFNENEARNLFRQIISAIIYCHSNGIAHRDLKPENFLFLTKHEDSPLKLIDFGLSTNFDSQEFMHTKAGTPYYISPEVLKGDYNQACDIWSAGVILYILLSGVPPFYGNTDQEILDAVKKGKYTFDIDEFKDVSEQAKNLISQMIASIDKRIKATDVIQHPWFKADIQKKKPLPLNFNALKNFTHHNKLKKIALTYIASQLSEQEIIEIGKLFRQLDENADGVLSVEEIKKGLKTQPQQDNNEINKVINSLDTDNSGKIDYTEFLAATIEKNLYMKEEKLMQVYKMLDVNRDGIISKDDLIKSLGTLEGYQSQTDKFWQDLIKEADSKNDGVIDIDEFIAMMGSYSLK